MAIKEGSGAFDGFDTPIHTMGTEPLYKLEPSLSLPPPPPPIQSAKIFKTIPILKIYTHPLFPNFFYLPPHPGHKFFLT